MANTPPKRTFTGTDNYKYLRAQDISPEEIERRFAEALKQIQARRLRRRMEHLDMQREA